MKLAWTLIILCFMLLSCTTVGLPDEEALESTDFGPAEKLRICIYKDVRVSDKQTDKIIVALRKEFSQFGLEIKVPWIKAWKRPAFAGNDIIESFAACPLEPPCDRLLALVGRSFGDFLWGILLPEMLGAVEDVSMTKGFAVANVGSFNQMLSLSGPARIAIHETYHLLGCGHSVDAKSCYKQIVRIKIMASNLYFSISTNASFIPSFFSTFWRFFRDRDNIRSTYTR